MHKSQLTCKKKIKKNNNKKMRQDNRESELPELAPHFAKDDESLTHHNKKND